MMKTLVVGDIHGCHDELCKLLDKAAIGPGDRIYSIGDLVNKGPCSREVLDFFLNEPNAHAIMGNHEWKHISHHAHGESVGLAPILVREELGADYRSAVKWMESLPHCVELEEAILIHAFFEPDVKPASQHLSIALGLESGEAYLKRKYGWPWYKNYRGEKPIIVGHRDYDSSGRAMVYRDRVFAIDTSCCEGFALTGLLLPDFKLIAVPSARNYWAELKAANKARKEALSPATPKPPFLLKWNDLDEKCAEMSKHRDEHSRRLAEQLSQTRDLAHRQLDQLATFLHQVAADIPVKVKSPREFRKLPRELQLAFGSLQNLEAFAPLLEQSREHPLDAKHLKKRFRRPRDIYEVVSLLGIDGIHPRSQATHDRQGAGE